MINPMPIRIRTEQEIKVATERSALMEVRDLGALNLAIGNTSLTPIECPALLLPMNKNRNKIESWHSGQTQQEH